MVDSQQQNHPVCQGFSQLKLPNPSPKLLSFVNKIAGGNYRRYYGASRLQKHDPLIIQTNLAHSLYYGVLHVVAKMFEISISSPLTSGSAHDVIKFQADLTTPGQQQQCPINLLTPKVTSTKVVLPT